MLRHLILACACLASACAPADYRPPGSDFALPVCVVEDLDQVDAYLEATFGWWAADGGLTEWCDAPAALPIFAPLDSYWRMTWSACVDDVRAGTTSCEDVPGSALNAVSTNVVWRCDGADTVIGQAVEWDCAGIGHDGAPEWSTVGRWRVDEAWTEVFSWAAGVEI